MHVRVGCPYRQSVHPASAFSLTKLAVTDKGTCAWAGGCQSTEERQTAAWWGDVQKPWGHGAPAPQSWLSSTDQQGIFHHSALPWVSPHHSHLLHRLSPVKCSCDGLRQLPVQYSQVWAQHDELEAVQASV